MYLEGMVTNQENIKFLSSVEETIVWLAPEKRKPKEVKERKLEFQKILEHWESWETPLKNKAHNKFSGIVEWDLNSWFSRHIECNYLKKTIENSFHAKNMKFHNDV